MPPKCTDPVPSSSRYRIDAALATLLNRDKKLVKKVQPLVLHQWGKVRRIDGEDADTMVAADIGQRHSDQRDASYVRVCLKSSAH